MAADLMYISRFIGALALLCAASPALSQSTYVTPAGTRVAGVVPLVCDTNGINCSPSGSGGVVNQVQGDVAFAGVDSGNPVKIGGLARSSLVGAVSNGQRTNASFGLFGGLFTFNAVSSTPTDAFANGQVGYQVEFSGGSIVPAQAGYVFNGTTWDRQRGDVNGTVTQPALSTAFWSYAAAAGGILNTTTAVTFKAAAGASVRNYVSAMQCNSEAFTTASELAIRDGAAGTVLWRGKIPTTGWTQGREILFSPALRGTANTLTEIVTLTASGAGAVYCNLQGYTGS